MLYCLYPFSFTVPKTAVIFDELHSQPNRELFDVMTKGSGDARTQPLFFLRHHIHRHVKDDGCLLTVRGTAVNLCAPLIITAGHI